MLRIICSQAFVLVLGLWMLPGCVQSKAHIAQRPAAQRSTAPAEKMPHLNNAQLADLHMSLGRGLENQGELDKAAKLYSDVLAREGERADACARLAILADKKGRFAESRTWHRKALELDPNNPDWHCNLGYSLYLQEAWEAAQDSLARALQLKPDHGRAHTNMGLVLARLGHVEEAFAEFREAGCSEADAHSNLAHGLALSGKLDLARHHYRFALRCDPNSPSATRGLQSINQILARRAAASQGSETAKAAPEEKVSPARNPAVRAPSEQVSIPQLPSEAASTEEESEDPSLPALPSTGVNWPPKE